MNRMRMMDVEEEIVSKSHRYAVEGIVGEGAYGVVLKCSCKKTGDVVAIKKFKDTEDDETVRKTILREDKILRMLKHENIVCLIDAFRRKKRLYLVFEFLQRNLLQVLEEKPLGLEPELIRIYIFQLVRAIRYCHQHAIVHRDIKPENLLVNLPPDPTLKLCDFGFARTVQSRSSQLTDYVATRWYRAPELLLGLGNYGKAVDIWAIGCIMGELIDAQPLFPGESDIDQLFVIRKVLGPLTEHQREMFLHNPRFLGMKLPEIGRPETLQRRYHGKITKSQLSLMKSLLEMDERQRFTIDSAYESPYFSKLRERTHSILSYPTSSLHKNDDSSSMQSKKENLNNSDSTSSSLIMKAATNSLNKNKTPDFVAEGINPIKVPSIIPHSVRRDIMPSRNPPITPPLITHDPSLHGSDSLAMTIQTMQAKDINCNKRKRRDLRSRGANNDKSDGRRLRSRHIKHRKKKHRKHRHHHKPSMDTIKDNLNNHLNINNASNKNTDSKIIEHDKSIMEKSEITNSNSGNNEIDYDVTPRQSLNESNKDNSSSIHSHSTSLASIQPHSHIVHRSQYGHGQLPNVSNMHISNHSHHHPHNSRTISRRGNKTKRSNISWNRRTSQDNHYMNHHQHTIHHHGVNLIRDTKTTGGEPINGSLNSSRQQYKANNLHNNALPQLGRVLTELPNQSNDNANGSNSNQNNNDVTYSGRNHHLRSRKSDRRSRVSSFANTDASPRMYGGSYKQRTVGFTFSRYQHSRHR